MALVRGWAGRVRWRCGWVRMRDEVRRERWVLRSGDEIWRRRGEVELERLVRGPLREGRRVRRRERRVARSSRMANALHQCWRRWSGQRGRPLAPVRRRVLVLLGRASRPVRGTGARPASAQVGERRIRFHRFAAERRAVVLAKDGRRSSEEGRRVAPARVVVRGRRWWPQSRLVRNRILVVMLRWACWSVVVRVL